MNVKIFASNPREMRMDEIVSLNGITARCFQKEVPLDETVDHVRSSDSLHLIQKGEKVIGYGLNSRLNILGTTVNYFGSGFIDPDYQDKGLGLYEELNLIRFRGIPTKVIMTRTQNPKVYSAFGTLCLSLGFRFSPCTERKVDKFALSLARSHFSDCDDRQFCRGAYGRELMIKTPLARGAVANVMRHLNVKNGDAVVLVGLSRRVCR